VRIARTEELTAQELDAIHELMFAAFGEDFRDEDWEHALGGLHIFIEDGPTVLSHASVVARTLIIGSTEIDTGFVEAVATTPRLQGSGLGSDVMRTANEHINDTYPLGWLGTGSNGFYERLGWRTWRGPSHLVTDDGWTPTSDEDGYLMYLRTAATTDLDDTLPVACHWRPGDVW
jgi:aminoglycoside 2'-N-acetyltransferase I